MPAKKKGSCKGEHAICATLLAISETKSRKKGTIKIKKSPVQPKASEPPSKTKSVKRAASKVLPEEAPVQSKKLNLEPLGFTILIFFIIMLYRLLQVYLIRFMIME